MWCTHWLRLVELMAIPYVSAWLRSLPHLAFHRMPQYIGDRVMMGGRCMVHYWLYSAIQASGTETNSTRRRLLQHRRLTSADSPSQCLCSVSQPLLRLSPPPLYEPVLCLALEDRPRKKSKIEGRRSVPVQYCTHLPPAEHTSTAPIIANNTSHSTSSLCTLPPESSYRIGLRVHRLNIAQKCVA